MKRLFSRNSKPLEKTRFISELNTRCLLSISGKDFLTVLQGLFSNNIDYSNSSSSAIFGFFLNKEGQVISDAIISRPNVLFNNSISARINEVFIECSKDVCKALFYHLKRHSMRRKVDISILPGFRIYAIYSPYASQMDNKKPGSSWDMFYDKTPQSEVFLSDEKESDFLYVDSCFVDPRLPSLGMRIYSGDPTMDYIETVMKDNDDIEMTSNGIYNFLRILNSVPEGSETYGWFPHNVNGDFLNGVFVRKGGGFLGQEKVARTIHNEVVQKRPMPFLIKNTHDSNLKWTLQGIPLKEINQTRSNDLKQRLLLKTESGKSIGVLIGQSHNLALMMVDSIGISSSNDYSFQNNGEWFHMLKVERTMKKIVEYEMKIKEKVASL